MKVTVRLFALARQLVGSPQVDVFLPEGATVRDLKRALVEAHPALTSLLPTMMFSVNTEYAADVLPIPPGAEVAAIPPVSGG